MGNLTQHFSYEEFECRCWLCKSRPVNPLLVECLEKIRDEAGRKPIHVLSGVRCMRHNIAVGGAPRSMHLMGSAADIVSRHLTPKELYDIIDTLWPERFGLGLYKTFVHFDIRERKARW